MTALMDSIQETTTQIGAPAAWAERHLAGWRSPVGFEVALKYMVLALDQYGSEMRRQFGREVGNDGVLGPAYRDIVEAVLTLLNGDLGRLDGGTLDKLVRAIAHENGIELDA